MANFDLDGESPTEPCEKSKNLFGHARPGSACFVSSVVAATVACEVLQDGFGFLGVFPPYEEADSRPDLKCRLPTVAVVCCHRRLNPARLKESADNFGLDHTAESADTD